MSEEQGRTNPPGNDPYSDSEDEDEDALEQHPKEFSNSAPGEFRSRTIDYKARNDFPAEPLYSVGEQVFISVPGQAQPAGPYLIAKVLDENQYKVRRGDTGVELQQSVRESDLLGNMEAGFAMIAGQAA